MNETLNTEAADKQETLDRNSEVISLSDQLPPNLSLLPVSQISLFPGMVVPVILSEGKLSESLKSVIEGSGYVGVVITRSNETSDSDVVAAAPGGGSPTSHLVTFSTKPLAEEIGGIKPEHGDFFPYGVAARVLKRINLPDQQLSLLLAGLQRFRIEKILKHEPGIVASVKYLPDIVENGTELEAMLRSAITQFKQISKDNPFISEEVKVALVNIDGPGKLSDFMASILLKDVVEHQQFLALPDVNMRLQHLLLVLKRELEVQNVQKRIQSDVNSKIAASQREFYLHEQLKAIQKELGRHADERSRIVHKFRDRLKEKKPPAQAKKRIDEEFEKLKYLHEQSSEYSVCLNYLDWATGLPWGIRTPDNNNLKQAREILDKDHFGLKDVKERILEFLAVRKLKQTSEGSIVCFVGAPGTGKTSLGRSIATALGRKFFQFSVGGLRDEAEIKGHRRTYVGALPGKIIQGLKRVEAQNPVFLIDEVDKMGTSWASGGDPASALLEVLDSEQNKEFVDHYLDIPFNCSEVFFITTANTVDTIPSALLDRMELIFLHGYTDTEKFNIAKNHLLPKQLKKNALKRANLSLSDSAIHYIIQRYAREAGVRNLEKQIEKICRKVAFKISEKNVQSVNIDLPKVVEKYLGKPPFEIEQGVACIPGVATGLAWTQYGGEVLHVESLAVAGKGGLILTGTLGKVMQESANIAYSFVRDRLKPMNLEKDYFDNHQLHLHVPAGATPKDGPSAGITIAASLYSLMTKKSVPEGLAMTGELTLSGRVLPVGGIKEKLLAAKRSNIRTVILPKANEKDLSEIETDVRKGLEFIKVKNMDEVFRALFRQKLS